MTRIKQTLRLIALTAAAATPLATVQAVDWEQIDTPNLPPSVKVFRNTTDLPSGPTDAWYAEIDLQDPNLDLKAALAPNGGRQILPEIVAAEEQPVYVGTNGGFFDGAGTSVSVIFNDGQLLAAGQMGTVVPAGDPEYIPGTYYPTRATFGVLSDGSYESLWAYPKNAAEIFAYDIPAPISFSSGPLPVPSETYPTTAQLWMPDFAMGGLSMLVREGVQMNTVVEEIPGDVGSFDGINPRTLIGNTADGKLILMVIDGRAPSRALGVTLDECSDLMFDLGCVNAVNLDGGGSSTFMAEGSILNTPSDPEGPRAVGSGVLIVRAPRVEDTEMANYSETGSGWFETSSGGSYGPSNTRLVEIGDGSAFAEYTFPGLPTAKYLVEAQYVSGSNRSPATPYTVKRSGLADATVLMNQQSGTGVWNTVGTFDLSAGDSLVISNDAAASGASVTYIAVDAIRLTYVGESAPELSFTGGDLAALVVNNPLDIEINAMTSNTGQAIDAVSVYKSVDGGAETMLAGPVALGGSVSESYTFQYDGSDPVSSVVALRFEVEYSQDDVRGNPVSRTVSKTFTVNLTPFELNIPSFADDHEAGREICLPITVDSAAGAGFPLTSLEVYKSVDGDAEVLVSTIPLSGTTANETFCYLVDEVAGREIAFRIVASDDQGNTAESVYTATIIPAVGDFRVAFLNDINDSFGSTTYSSHVITAVAWMADAANSVDLVIGGGDFVAGQSASLSDEQIDAMWQGFSDLIHDQLKAAGIEFVGAMGNHDSGLDSDRAGAERYWNDPANKPNVTYVEEFKFPFSYSATVDFDSDGQDDIFFVAMDAGATALHDDDLEFLERTLQTPEAQNARLRIAASHRPLFAVSNERNSDGFVTRYYNAAENTFEVEPILDIISAYGVDIWFAGDSAAYFPGELGDPAISFPSGGEMAGLGKAYIGENQAAPTSMTIMDVFVDDPYYGQNAFVYTTYAILLQNEQGGFYVPQVNGQYTEVVTNDEMPAALFGFDGNFVKRNDIELSDVAETVLSPVNLTDAMPQNAATGMVRAEVIGDEVVITGSFSDLHGTIVPERDAVALYQARHNRNGEILALLEVTATDGKSGTFEGTLPIEFATKDALAVGYYSVIVRSTEYPQGELRGTLFNDLNKDAPSAPVVTSPAAGETTLVRDVEALLTIEWDAVTDPQKSPVTYLYEVATDAAFTNKVIVADVDNLTQFQRTEAEWFELLGESTPAGTPVTLYQKVTATDGQNVVESAITELTLEKNTDPLTGPVEIPPPPYEYKGVFAQLAGWQIYDIAVDEATGRIWTCTYTSGIQVYNPDGSPYILTHPAVEYVDDYVAYLNWRGFRDRLNPLYGIAYDQRDGNMVVVQGGGVFKVDSVTGQPLRYISNSALPHSGVGANPSVSESGLVYVHNVFPGNGAYILEETGPSDPDPLTYKVVSPLTLREVVGNRPNVARTSHMSPEGDMIYAGDASASNNTYIFESADGKDFAYVGTFERLTSTVSNATDAFYGKQLWAISNKATTPPPLQFVDFDDNVSWTYFLSDNHTTDIRGFGLGLATSPSGWPTQFFVGDSNEWVLRYALNESSGPSAPAEVSIWDVRQNDGNGVASLLGQYVKLEGMVVSPNFSATGLELLLSDGTYGVMVIHYSDTLGYTPAIGDTVEVVGWVGQHNGQTFIKLESIATLPLPIPAPAVKPVDALAEGYEGMLVKLDGLTLVDPAQWMPGIFGSFTVEVTDGSEVFTAYIDGETDLASLATAPTGSFELTGVVTQFDTTSPFFSGYEIKPRGLSDLGLEGAGVTLNADKTFVAAGETATFTVSAPGVTNPSYTWFDNGVEIPGETNAFYATNSLAPGNAISVKVLEGGSLIPLVSNTVSVNVSPVLEADQTQNDVVSDITVTFADDAAWRAAIIEVLLDSVTVDPADYAINAGEIVLAASLFPAETDYTVTVVATDYADTSVVQPIYPQPPVLTADPAARVGDSPVLTFSNGGWSGAITEVLVDGNSAGFTADSSTVTVDASAFSAPGDYLVEVLATGYTTAEVLQTILAAPAPEGLVEDTTNNEAGNSLVIQLPDDAAWIASITNVTVDGAAIYGAYSIDPVAKTLTILGVFTNDLSSGDLDIVIEATGYEPLSFLQPIFRTAYCDATGGNPTGEYIANVSVGQIDHDSTHGGGYSDFTSLFTAMSKGRDYDVEVTAGNRWYRDELLIWIDWNQDFDFDDAGELYDLGQGEGPYTGVISVPADAKGGWTTMRVRLHDYGNGPNATPCGPADWGEVEDYSVYVIQPTGTYATGAFDESAAEIAGYSPVYKRLFVTNSDTGAIDVLDIQDPANPTKVTSFDVGDVNSVAVFGRTILAAVEGDTAQDPGKVLWLSPFGTVYREFEVGALPDMITITPDGLRAVVACEGEPNDDYTVDPEGSVAIINLYDRSEPLYSVKIADFSAFNGMEDELRAAGVRIFGPNASAAQDFEPEYVAVSPDSKTAYVTLQENNALAIVDIATATVTDVLPLGFKDHSLPGNELDVSDRDGAINIQNWPILGMYMPDAIDAFDTVLDTYLITANEGDARDYDTFGEEVRVKNLALDPTVFPDAATLQLDENLGRLEVTDTLGDTDGDGDYDAIYSFGARSFTIWNKKGELVFDSGAALEQITAAILPDEFNSTNDENGSFDSRSDAKGPEPEGVEIGVIDERTYAFVGLERIGGVVIYDVTDPTAPVFVEYFNNRDFSGDAAAGTAGDLGPEGLLFISEADSPNGNPLLVVTNEVSGTTSIFDLFYLKKSPSVFSLQIAHSSDNESSFVDPNTLEEKILGYGAIMKGLNILAAREHRPILHLTAGDHTLPGVFYEASALVPELGFNGVGDIEMFNSMDLIANGMGNHEFDGGINEFAEMLARAEYPFIAANLDFRNVQLDPSTTPIEIGEDAMHVDEVAGKVVRSAWVEVGGEKIGFIGRAPADFFNVIEDPATNLPGLDFFGGRDPQTNQPLVSAVGQVLDQVKKLEAKGVNKIILLDHAQDFTGDPLSASSLRGIDIIVAAGATGFQAKASPDGPYNLLRPEDAPGADYPVIRTDMDGNPVVAINSDQIYRYVGNLIVDFDENGIVTNVDDRSGPITTDPNGVAALEAELGLDSLEAPCGVQETFELLRNTSLIQDQFGVIATTAFELNGQRIDVRGRETNLGRLAADSTVWYAQEYVDANNLGITVDIALKNGGGIRDTITGPSIIKLNIAAALAFNNGIVVVEMRADELIALAENSVSRVPAADGRFPQLSGMALEYDPAQPGVQGLAVWTDPTATSRVRNLTVLKQSGDDVVVANGVPQGDLSRTFWLATNSFLLTGGDGYAGLAAIANDPVRSQTNIVPDLRERDVLQEYLIQVLGGSVNLPDPTPDPLVTTVNQVAVLANSFPGQTSVTGTRITSEWFGSFDANTAPWVKHDSLDWMQIGSADASGVWLWKEAFNWGYTTEGLYPFFFSSDTGNWIWYWEGTSDPAWFYDFASLEWFTE